MEYSLDGGTTWVNPYGVGVGWTGNFGASPGYTIPPIITPTSSNFRFRFNFVSDWTIVSSGYKITDFDIVCNVQLPIDSELIFLIFCCFCSFKYMIDINFIATLILNFMN